MTTYVFSNKQKSKDSINKYLVNNYDLHILEDKTDVTVLGNDMMLINISNERTNILLYTIDYSIKKVRNYFMENTYE